MQRHILIAAMTGILPCLVFPALAQVSGQEEYDRGVELSQAGKYAEAIAQLSNAIQLDGRNFAAYHERGMAWEHLKKYDKAIADYDQSITLHPGDKAAYNNRGKAWYEKGDCDKAIADYDRAIKLGPNYDLAYCNRGLAWGGKREYDKEIADYDRAIKLNPSRAVTYYYRAVAWKAKHEYEKATADYHQAIRLDPNDINFYKSFSWLQATCPEPRYRDGKAALANAKRAYQLGGGTDWLTMEDLAAAYAEIGDFTAAKQWETKAIEIAEKSSTVPIEHIAYARGHLALYQVEKPCHEEVKRK